MGKVDMWIPLLIPIRWVHIRTEELDYSLLPDKKYDWSRAVYGNMKEQVPEKTPPLKGKAVVLTCYRDANLYHDLMMGRAVTGILHFINKTPVDWHTKKQAPVKTATYGSKFTSVNTAIQANRSWVYD